MVFECTQLRNRYPGEGDCVALRVIRQGITINNYIDMLCLVRKAVAWHTDMVKIATR